MKTIKGGPADKAGMRYALSPQVAFSRDSRHSRELECGCGERLCNFHAQDFLDDDKDEHREKK